MMNPRTFGAVAVPLAALLLLPYNVAQAQWSNEAIKMYEDFAEDENNQPFESTYQATLWGAIRANYSRFKAVDVVKLKSKEFEKGHVKSVLHIQTEIDTRFEGQEIVREEKTVRSPLVVVIPGIFSSAVDSRARLLHRRFKKMGYHVAVLPNPWSDVYIKANPNSMPGDVFHEAKVMLELLTDAKRRVGEENITVTHVVGLSYGGYLAPIVATFDKLDHYNLIDGQTTMVGPPLDMRTTIKKLDKLIELEIPEVRDVEFRTLVKVIADYLKFRSGDNISPTSKKYSRPLVVSYGFHKPLLSTLKRLNKVKKMDFIPKFENKEERIEWENQIGFRFYLDEIAPEIRQYLDSHFADLHYWMDKAMALNDGKVRLITAADDFLNTTDIEPYQSKARAEEHTMVLPSGGHLGFMHLPWFKEFCVAVYAQK
jgi:predicted alpha/beta-fold hydrolase